ncbi:MAG: hypothetical protein KDD44_00545 [Bdellovibrionales bacterium]|nr:hypothetical protein [Bdellovibrionales bacterium]
MKQRSLTVLAIAAASVMFGCSSNKPAVPPPATPVFTEAVAYVDEVAVPHQTPNYWEAPMYDQIQVPAALDPTGTYYRPSHKTIVEIRQGRFQRVQYPDDTQQNSR